jgi:cytochrome c oxidase assembly protein subunit 15
MTTSVLAISSTTDTASPAARRYRWLVFAATVLTFVVVVVGAYVRLSDAGLGCPDWPGCYGRITPVHAREDIARAVEAQGGTHGPVSMPKAWKEMGHRYLAGTLGLIIALVAALAWRHRRELHQSPWLATGLLVVVLFQATLGMWTVTLLLKPVIVTLHLLGGMTLLALLGWLSMRQLPTLPPGAGAGIQCGLRRLARIGLVLVFAQIALGGWVSSNYAALACTDFPLCHGRIVPAMDWSHAFDILRKLGMTVDGDPLPAESLVAMHFAHRLGAYVVLLFCAYLAWRLARFASTRGLALLLATAVAAQFTLGVLNVLLSLPLPLAAAHNAGAALLLVALVVINYCVGLPVHDARALPATRSGPRLA